jgi:hypothetical protein
MGFMDKVKEQAAVATALAKDTAQKGHAKVDAAQAKRAADGLLRTIGLAVYLDRTERGSSSAQEQLDAAVESLREYETEYGELKPEDGAAGA